MFKILQKAIKFRYLLSWLIAFFIGGILYTFTCHAQSLPSPSPDVFALIEGGNNSLFSSGFSTQSVFPFKTDAETISSVIRNASVNPIESGTLVNAVSSSQVDIRPLTNDEITNNEVLYPYLYDVNGNPVQWDDVYFAHYDNGFCHGELYIDSDGNILTSDSSNTLTMFQLGLGGSLLGVTDLANIYSIVADELFQQQYNISLNGADLSNYSLSYYFHGGRVSNGRKTEWIIYVPNIYSQGVSVAGSYTNGQALNNIYYNDGSGVVFKAINTNGGQPFNIMGSVTKDGFTYSHNFSQATYIDGQNNNRTAFESGTTGRYNFSLTNFTYNSSLQSSVSDTVSFKKLQFPDNIKTLQLDDTYDYNSISEYESLLNTLPSSVNNNFDSSQNINEINYPYNFTLPSDAPESSSLPMPTTNNNPLPNPEPILDYGVVTQPSNQSILDSFSNLQIPFLNNIRYRFPFCIPWDIRDAISLLQFSPTAPAWNFDWKITTLGTTYTYHFEGDLSDFDSLATIFRRLMLLAVILGLAFWSYKIFF